jgi:hypothetical protein
MMPRHLNMIRSQCRVLSSHGGGTAHTLLTLRFSPRAGQANALEDWLSQSVLPRVATRAGLTGIHLLKTQTPAGQALTTEQAIRGGDAVADWILLANGYDPDAVGALVEGEFHEQTLVAHGAVPARLAGIYRLALSLSSREVE